MAREDWKRGGPRDDYGQADYSTGYGYDADRRRGYRAGEAPAGSDGDYRYDPDSGLTYRRYEAEQRTFGGPLRRTEEERRASRREPSDRVLWAVIVERLQDVRGLDLSDVEVFVEDGEVTLNGTVRRKGDRRKLEDLVDIDGVDHVQNNLRVRERGRWLFF